MDRHEAVDLYGGVVRCRPLTAQEELVLHDRRATVQSVDAAGDHLDGKALGLLQAASLVLALVAIAGDLDWLSLGLVERAGLGVALLAFGLMLGAALAAWSPREYWAPGVRDWDQMVERYLRADTTDALLQTISNYDGLLERLMERNATKGRWLRAAVGLFVVQVGALALAVLA